MWEKKVCEVIKNLLKFAFLRLYNTLIKIVLRDCEIILLYFPITDFTISFPGNKIHGIDFFFSVTLMSCELNYLVIDRQVSIIMEAKNGKCGELFREIFLEGTIS